MDASSVAVKANLPFSQVKRTSVCGGQSGIWGQRIVGCPRIKRATSTKNRSFCGGLHAKPGVAFSVLTPPDVSEENLVFHGPLFPNRRADPKSVASIILGEGAGIQLFPLTKRRATPAVPIGGCYRLIDIPMSNCINSGINKIFITTQYNSTSLNRHISRTYQFGDGISFRDGFVEVLAATQSPGKAGMNWFQGTADAVRQFTWILEDYKNKNVEHILILSGDQLYRMNYMDIVQKHIDEFADITISCVPVSHSQASDYNLVKINKAGHITEFSHKPMGAELDSLKDAGEYLRLSPQDFIKYPYIASMGVYVFRRDTLLDLLRLEMQEIYSSIVDFHILLSLSSFRWNYPESNCFESEILPSAVKDHDVQAYLFIDYWEDLGTIKSFFDANLTLTEQPPKFQFYDPRTPIYTSPQFLPPSKIEKSRVVDSIISHGSFLNKCSIEHSIVGVRSRLDCGVELKDTMMMGADMYETKFEMANLLSDGKVPIGVGEDTKIRNCIIDKNARIGKNVVIVNKDGVQEADKTSEGFFIRSGITIILKNATIKDGTVI
ncbi:glucose-1-phosphate adenylyltransferase large subunit 1-like [Canna indica]|uniref:glucose-1-phosphate adenylyltransferase n=1 Tax=Canna indica TaxID=4628 RepID=A0AAQ3QGB1_9LILI|nr:glucose-1-phosphate adenylyltransferase large subunit 1-like [Canna indica]